MEDKLRHLPEKTRATLTRFAQTLIETFGDDLYSLMLYGSAARSAKRNGDEFREGTSDMNTVIILEQVGTQELNGIIGIGRKFKKSGLALPLVFKKGHIMTSLDTFPLEFSDMKDHHILLYGTDPLEDAKIETRNLRHQCEVEFKGQLVQLRRGYLASNEDPEALTALISASVASILAACRGMVLIAGEVAPNNKEALLKLVEDKYEIDTEPIKEATRIKHGESGGATAALELLFDSYMKAIEKLADVVDKL